MPESGLCRRGIVTKFREQKINKSVARRRFYDVNLKIVTTAAVAVVLTTSAAFGQAQEAVDNPFLPLGFGESQSAFLTAADDSLADGSFYKMFLFAGEAGDSVTITVNSLDFNAHLLFADSLDTILADDSDSGGLCNAHLTHVLPTSGRYIVYATTFHPHDVGEFEISLTKGSQAPAETRPCAGFFDKNGTLSVGDSAMGTLGPPDQKLGPTYYQVWGIDVPEGETVTIDLQSIIFDARLTLLRGFASRVDANDDGAGACNARLVLTGDGHPYSVLMTTGKQDETGPYILRVQEGALPIVQESQCEG
jgi:hypothetical protein